jgi:NADP-dependent 3-hydroxy acid dehydrogenase YdfG
LQKGKAANNVRVINIAPGFVKTSIHVDMGISFEAYCEQLGNPDFISADELADIILFCWKQPQRLRIRDIVVMPTTSSFA